MTYKRAALIAAVIAVALIVLSFASGHAAVPKPGAMPVEPPRECTSVEDVQSSMQSVVDVSGGLVLIYRGAEAQRVTDAIRGRFGIPLSRVSALAVLVHAPVALAMFDAAGCLAASNLVRPEVFFEALAPPS